MTTGNRSHKLLVRMMLSAGLPKAAGVTPVERFGNVIIFRSHGVHSRFTVRLYNPGNLDRRAQVT